MIIVFTDLLHVDLNFFPRQFDAVLEGTPTGYFENEGGGRFNEVCEILFHLVPGFVVAAVNIFQ